MMPAYRRWEGGVFIYEKSYGKENQFPVRNSDLKESISDKDECD